MLSSFLSSESGLSSGGTITGDLTISGDLTVSGGGSYAYSEVLTGDMAITNTAATVGLTINQSGDNYALSINQDDADKAALYIDAETTTSHVIYIDGPATTTASTIRLDGLGGLTTGAMFNANITSANLETGAGTGAFRVKHSANSGSKVSNIMHLHNDHASSTGVTVLTIAQDSTNSALTVHGAAGSGSASGAVVRLQTAEETVVDGDYLGRIEFLAPAEASGTDAILAGAAIWAEADDTFAADNNSTELVFGTNTSAAYTERMRIDSSGNVGIGTASPDARCEIANAGGAVAALHISNANAAYGTANELLSLEYNDAQTLDFYTDASDDFHIAASDNNIEIHTVSAHDIILQESGGSVGIGTTVPTATGSSLGVLHVENSTTSSATQGASIRLSSKDGAAVTGDDHRLGVIDFAGEEDTSGTLKVAAQIEAFADAAFSATGDYGHAGRLEFAVQSSVTGTDQLAVPAMIIDANSRISLSNNDGGDNNTIFGKTAGDPDGAGDKNVFIGELAGGTGTQTDAADENVGIGYSALTDLTQGAENTAVGSGAGANLTAVSGNTMLGRSALYTSTAAVSCVAIGQDAMAGGTATQAGTIAIGASALTALTSGAGNVAVGYTALSALTTGTKSVALGYEALNAMQEGIGNIAIGWEAMKGANHANIDNNIAIGASAMNGMGTADGGEGNIAIGADALGGALTSDQNIAIGQSALTALTSGQRNMAVGYQALLSVNGAESDNVALGYEAMKLMAVSASDQNTAIGNYAMSAITSGGVEDCVAIGYNAFVGDSGASAAGTTAIGSHALKQLSTAVGNTAVGYYAGGSLTTGERNTIMGYAALDAGTTETDDNVAIGYYAMGGAIGTERVNDCVAVGADALSGALDSTNGIDKASGTVAIGKSALAALTSGAKNTALGYQAANLITSGSECTVVGYDSDVDSNDAVNQTVIGSEVTGVADNSVTLGNANVTKVYMASDGLAKVYLGNIEFPATQSTSTNANTLDDYEEGTFGTTSANGILYPLTSGTITCGSTVTCHYTKIGRVVSITVRAIFTAASSPVGYLGLVLPFACVGFPVGAVRLTNITFSGYMTVQADHADSNAKFTEIATGAAISYIDGSDLSSGDELRLELTYFTS